MIPKILVFAGSIRSGAYSGLTADAAQRELALQGADVTRISLADYPLPIMDEDLETEKGIPENAIRLAGLFDAQDGLLIASPEYNSSIPPLLKNTIDWVSRVGKINGKPVKPYAGKAVGLCSSSDGHFAGVRGLYHLRAVLMNCRADIITPQCSVPSGGDAFEPDGEFKDEHLRSRMRTVCATLIERSRLLSTRVEH